MDIYDMDDSAIDLIMEELKQVMETSESANRQEFIHKIEDILKNETVAEKVVDTAFSEIIILLLLVLQEDQEI